MAANPINKKGCHCTFWVRGTIEGKKKRESLKTKNFERAEELKREREGAREKKKRMTLAEAIASYESDFESRVKEPTRKKTHILLVKLQTFADKNGIEFLDTLGLAELRDFRKTWDKKNPKSKEGWGALTQYKNLERLKAFCRFCIQAKWMEELPLKSLKSPERESTHIVPFEEDELEKIHAAIKQPVMRAFILTLEHSGLRISDAVQLQKQEIVNGKLCIRTKKTKSIVWLPLPPSLLAALEQIKTTQYYFWTGVSKLSTVIGSKRRGVAKLLDRAHVEGNPHKFRHTLATNLLLRGTSPAIVAKILGNSPRVVEKYYDHWIQARQNQLELEIQKTWPQPKLALVK